MFRSIVWSSSDHSDNNKFEIAVAHFISINEVSSRDFEFYVVQMAWRWRYNWLKHVATHFYNIYIYNYNIYNIINCVDEL